MITPTTLRSLKAVRHFPLALVAALALSCGSSESKQSVQKPSKPSEKPSVSVTQTNQQPATGATPTQKPAADTTAAPKTPPPATTIQFSAYDIDGKLHKADEWVGKQPVILNFWGTWCGPCRREIPELIKLYSEYKNKGIEIVSIAVRDTPTKVRRVTQQQGMNWVMLMDDRKISREFRITGIPTTFFINRNGEITDKFVGPRSYDVFKKAFEAIL